MTKKDYIVIADTLVELINSGTLGKYGTGVDVYHTFVNKLKMDNHKFNETTFQNYISERI